jgi:hypothetical protein
MTIDKKEQQKYQQKLAEDKKKQRLQTQLRQNIKRRKAPQETNSEEKNSQ